MQLRKLYVALIIAIVGGYSIIQILLLTVPPVDSYDDPVPSHYVQLWGAAANFTYIFDIGWYHSEQDAMMGVNQESGWGTRIRPDGDTNRTGRFYRIPESANFVWTHIELIRSENGDETLVDSTHCRFDIGLKKTIVVGGLVFSLLVTRAPD